MVRFGKLPPRQQPPKQPTTQYDLVEVAIGEMKAMARPFEFATVPTTSDLYAIKYSTACPKCGHGITLEVGSPPAPSVSKDGVGYQKPDLRGMCDNCKLGEVRPPQPMDDPFRNPVMEGLLTMADLDPLQAAAGLLEATPTTTVADRLKKRQSAETLKEKGALELGEEQDIEDDDE